MITVYQCSGCECGTCQQETMDPDCPEPAGQCHFHPKNLTVWRRLGVVGDENKPGCFGAVWLPGKRTDKECPCEWFQRCKQSQEDS